MRRLFKFWRYIFVPGLLTVSYGCATIQPAVSPTREDQVAGLLALEQWELRGRIAVKNSTDGGQAKIHWRQSGDTSQIRFTGPFGAGAYELLWKPGLVTVTDGRGEQAMEYRGADAAEDFLREQLGWSFPAGSTRYWVMGLADPAGHPFTTQTV